MLSWKPEVKWPLFEYTKIVSAIVLCALSVKQDIWPYEQKKLDKFPTVHKISPYLTKLRLRQQFYVSTTDKMVQIRICAASFLTKKC